MRLSKLFLIAAVLPLPAGAAPATILSWNNLGMHCMDSDYSVFSVLPPYNTIEAQLIVNGVLITNEAGYHLTYEAVADPDGSFNSTSLGKGNYYTHISAIYGANLAPNQGLAGWDMPTISGASVTNAGTIQITAPIALTTAASPGLLTFSWPATIADVLLESSADVSSSAKWVQVTNAVASGPDIMTIPPPSSGNQFFRVRRPW